MNILKCIIGILIPFLGTTLGAAVVFAFRKPISDKLQKVFLGFASGVMVAASIWSLIIPAIENSEAQGNPGWIAATVGIISGAAFLILTDLYMKKYKCIKMKTSFKTSMLSLAITLHNIPEGMAVGVVFASALNGNFEVRIYGCACVCDRNCNTKFSRRNGNIASV